MDFDLPSADDPRRLAVRDWLAANPAPTQVELARAGYVAPHWPPPWGVDADPMHRLIITQELEAAGITSLDNPIGIGWAGPTILSAGSDAQRDRYLWPLLEASEIWCQMFSEPDAGSDLAGLATRAERDGDEWVIRGQKIWTSYADYAQFGILLARTDPDQPKHRGITYFICPVDSPGIEVRPIVEMTGGRHFNEVFFDEVRIPADNVVGDLHDGWRLAKQTLANERMSLSSGGVLWGMGPRTSALVELAAGKILSGKQRDRMARVHIESEVMRLIGLKVLTDLVHGRTPGPEVAVKKLMADRHGQHVMDLAKDLTGPGGMLTSEGPLGSEVDEWHWGFLFSPALTIGGGTAEVLRNVIGERILGLPRDPGIDSDLSWAESKRQRVG